MLVRSIMFTMHCQHATCVVPMLCSRIDITRKYMTVMKRVDVFIQIMCNIRAAPTPRYKCRACHKEMNAQSSVTKAVLHKLVEGSCPTRVVRPVPKGISD